MVHMFIHPAFDAHLYYLSSVVESCIYYIAWVSQDPMNHSVGQRGWARIESFPYRNRPMHLLTSCRPYKSCLAQAFLTHCHFASRRFNVFLCRPTTCIPFHHMWKKNFADHL